MILAPVILFVYNRVWHTKQTLEALSNNYYADKSHLFIFSDGYKNEEDKNNVLLVRKYLKTIKKFKKINIIERKRHYGLAKSVTNGVTEIINKYNKVIVLEDDLVTSPFFLEYMNNALREYQNNNQVMQISGHMFPVKFRCKTDAIFLSFTTSWGWATWKRAWKYFDPKMENYIKLKNNPVLKYKFNLNDSYNYFSMIQAQQKGEIDSWAIKWYLSVFFKNGLILYPIKSLVKNIGFDGSGTHKENLKIEKNKPDFKANILPKNITISEYYNYIIKNRTNHYGNNKYGYIKYILFSFKSFIN